MSFDATAVYVLIASPSDTREAREVIRATLDGWNSLHSEATGIVLLPLMWERDATPEMGDRPQAIVNRQIVERADILVGTFWTRLGTPTGEEESGTVEEIEFCIREGKPVLLYFSSQPVQPESLDGDEYERLRDFRADVEARGLTESYSSLDELQQRLMAGLTRTVRERFGGRAQTNESGVGPARLLAKVESEREIRGFSNSGNPQYRTRHRLIIENTGSTPVEDLDFDFLSSDEDQTPGILGKEETIRKLAPGASVSFPIAAYMGTASQVDIRLTWKHGDSRAEDVQTLTV